MKEFIAVQNINHLIVKESLLKSKKLYKLVDKLNKAGFGLGTGHDGMEMKKMDDGSYVFRLSPYVGHCDQYVFFKPIP